MDDRGTFGRWVKWRRNTLGLTQANLAQLVACSKDLIKKIEADTRRPSVQIVRRLADSLKIEADDYSSFLALARPELSAQPNPALQARAEHTPPQRLLRVPAPHTTLVSRAGEVGAIAALLRRSDLRLLTLTGSGGIGKTRLAIELATELQGDFADGVVFVPLATISDPGLVLPTIAQALRVLEPRDQPMRAFLHDYLRAKELLLVLDNFEQVVAAAHEIAALVAAAPLLKVLVTSRAVLHIAAEHEFVVPPLEVPQKVRAAAVGELKRYPAVALFVERARAVKPGFELTADNAPAVIEICARLDGLPLAIELAAARARLLPPHALLARLSGGAHISPLDLLARPSQDVPTRQQTLRSTIGWSYALLSPAEQQVFRWLGVFVGGCSLDAAEQVCGDFGLPPSPIRKAPVQDIYDLLVSLIDQSLVSQGADAGGEPRFTMLTTLREYALEQLAACGELGAARQSHAAYFLSLAELAEPTFRGADQQTWLARLEADHDNMRAALSWMCGVGAGEDALRFAAAFWQFWLVRGYLNEGQSWIATILALPAAAAPTFHRARVLNGGGLIAWLRSSPREAAALLSESLTLFRQLGNRHGCAWALNHLAQVAFAEERFDDVIALGEESLALFREIGAVWNSAWVLLNLGDALWALGYQERASALFAESLSLFHDSGDKRGTAWAIDHLARIAHAQGDYQRAAAFLAESLALFRELGDRSGCAWALDQMAQVAEATGERERARALYAESLAISRDLGDKSAIASCLISLSSLTYLEGRFERAVSMLGAADLILASLAPRLNAADRTTLERATALYRSALDPATFSAAWAAGLASSADLVIARVLAEL